MSAASATRLSFRRSAGRARWALWICAALAVLLAWLLSSPGSLARGWLAAFAFWSGFPVGSLVLLMIHRLTAGRWGDALAPVLRPAAAAVPLVALAFIPVAVALTAVYPWAGAGRGGADPSVTRLYLDPAWFLIRAAIALVGWSILGLVFGLGRGNRLLAALGLAFYGLTISVVAVDWILSLDPRFTSSAFAGMIAIQQLLTALAVAAAFSPPSLTDEAAGDIGAFLIATLLGVFYLSLISFIVSWYGDLPDKAAWYLKRGHEGWAQTIGAAIFLAVVSFGLLLRRRLRHGRAGVRMAGLVALGAVAVHVAWLTVPGFEDFQVAALVAACLFAFALAAVLAALRPRLTPADRPDVR